MSQRTDTLICLAILSLVQNYAMSQQSGQTNPQASQNPRRSMHEIVTMPVVYSIPGMDKVIVKSDLKYTDVNEPHVLMDIYIPPRLKKDALRPVVLFIHGSVPPGSPAKNMGVYRSWGRLVAASGMVGVTFTHRLGYPKPQLSEASSDVNAAVNFIRTNAASLHIDKFRICLVAYSGGGPMLSMAMRDRPAYVRCLVAFYAFLDVQQSELHQNYETPVALKSFSPITYLANDPGTIVPIFIARAGLDDIPTLNDSIDRFTREAISRNAAIIVANHPKGVHGFDTQTDDDMSREIIRSVLAFMKTNLGIKEARSQASPHMTKPRARKKPKRT